MMDHVPHVQLSDLPVPDAGLGELTKFANTFHGYRVWGNQERVIEVRDGVMPRLSGTRACTSVLKLRTAMFALARAARFTDELIVPSAAPGSAAFGTLQEATFESEMRGVVARMHVLMTDGPADDLKVAHAARLAAAAIPTDGPYRERDLRDHFVHAISILYNATPGASTLARWETTLGRLSGWDPADPPGKFDVAAGFDMREQSHQRYRVLAEVKWSDHNTVSHSLWDAAKLLAALVDRSDNIYLLGGWPKKIWNRAPAANLYQPGILDFRKLAELPGEWTSLLKHGQGTPLMLPNKIVVREIATIPIRRHDPSTHESQDWELRAVAIEPADEDWIWLKHGRLAGAIPLAEHDQSVSD